MLSCERWTSIPSISERKPAIVFCKEPKPVVLGVYYCTQSSRASTVEQCLVYPARHKHKINSLSLSTLLPDLGIPRAVSPGVHFIGNNIILQGAYAGTAWVVFQDHLFETYRPAFPSGSCFKSFNFSVFSHPGQSL